uniref:Low-density lipoprotein receptor-related protein 2 n=1 Tax=Strongyloides stercoralis TaxID=6248 RepID=A0A0K0EE50_STRER
MASKGVYEEPRYHDDFSNGHNISVSSKTDDTLPLPTYHVNNRATPISRSNGSSPRSRPSDEEESSNSCLLFVGRIWDGLIDIVGKFSLLNIILCIIGILLVICIPLVIIWVNQSSNITENEVAAVTRNVSKSLNYGGFFFPPNINTCPEYGFNCNNDPNEFIGIMQRCDGINHCSDGSDEENCQGCHSGFSCPSKANKNMLICLRGNKLCDGIVHCDDGSDETLFCQRSNCTENEFHCKSSNTCVPKSYQCDGDPQCPSGEDEINCSSCGNDAIFCASTNKCIPKWNVCDGIVHCPDKIDETNCECTDCSGNNRVLCKKSNFCIASSEVCDGTPNCPDGEDEEGCPGSCNPTAETASSTTLVKSFFENDFLKCNDGKDYIRKYACSGLLPQCEGVCNNECDRELAFTCRNGACISKSNRCDGVPDCVDGSDEEDCKCEPEKQYQCQVDPLTNVSKCINKNLLCDGVQDCPLGDDEKNCSACTTPEAIYCPSTKTCHPSITRCDGISQCPDESDELNCSCAECNLHPYKMYTCSTSNRCFRRESVCDPYSLCPNGTSVDVDYCLNRAMGGSVFFNRF